MSYAFISKNSLVIFASGGAVHTAISPSQEEHERVRAYCVASGIDDSNLNFVVGHLPASAQRRQLEPIVRAGP